MIKYRLNAAIQSKVSSIRNSKHDFICQGIFLVSFFRTAVLEVHMLVISFMLFYHDFLNLGRKCIDIWKTL